MPQDVAQARGPSILGRLITYGIIAVPVAVVIFAILGPRIDFGFRPANPPSICRNTLKQIGIALQTYHDAHHCLPPAYFADEHGTPTHSWRAILLPYFEGEEVHRLASQYRFDEPWNGPNNRQLLDKAPYPYRCPSDGGNESETSYLAIVGPDSMWRGPQPIAIPEMSDGTSKTIAIVECVGSGVNWLEPRDVTFDDAASGISVHSTGPAFRSNHTGGAFALFADASAHFLTDSINRDTLRGLLTPAGGETVEIPE